MRHDKTYILRQSPALAEARRLPKASTSSSGNPETGARGPRTFSCSAPLRCSETMGRAFWRGRAGSFQAMLGGSDMIAYPLEFPAPRDDSQGMALGSGRASSRAFMHSDGIHQPGDRGASEGESGLNRRATSRTVTVTLGVGACSPSGRSLSTGRRGVGRSARRIQALSSCRLPSASSR